MNIALWTKIKIAGPPQRVTDELQHFHFWLPVTWQPLNAMLAGYISEFESLPTAQKRWQHESETLQKVKRYIASHKHLAYRDLLMGFVDQISEAVEMSKQLRLQALNEDLSQTDFEEDFVRSLRLWLQQQRRSDRKEVIAWIERLLNAWWHTRRLG
jgi:hypothetical protein